MIEIFIASDVHGKFNELWQHLLSEGFELGNKQQLAILNGDIIDAYDDIVEVSEQINTIISYMQKYKNIIYIKGNHEAQIKLVDKHLKNFIDQLPIVYMNDNLFICHGWFNPKWTIAEHDNKMMNDDFKSSNYGHIYHGSPQNIIVREQLNKDYFGYHSFDQYEQTLINQYPNHTFVFGHYFNFLWSYDKCKHMHYFIYREELVKLQNGQDNLITTMTKEFDYSQPYISPTKKIYCLDVFTKCYKNNMQYYFYVLKFKSNSLGKLYNQNGQSYDFKFNN